MFNYANIKASQPARELAENNVAQSRAAVFGYLDAAKRSAEIMSGSVEQSSNNLMKLYARGFAHVEDNIRLAFDHTQKLVRADTLTEVVQLQLDFTRGHFAAMQTQVKEFGSAFQGVIEGAALPRKAVEQGWDMSRQDAESAGHAVDTTRY